MITMLYSVYAKKCFRFGCRVLLFSCQRPSASFNPSRRNHWIDSLEGRVKAVEQARVSVSDTVTGAETRVTLEFTLNGCLDSLMPLISRYEVQGSRATIYVTALNAHNQQSIAATCMGMPQASSQVSVPGVFGSNQIRVVFMGQRPQ
jgi:hypothetical protein